MKTIALLLLAGFAVSPVVAEPTMHDKITAALADTNHPSQPPRTAHDFAKSKDAKAEIEVEAAAQLPDYEVTAPLIPNKQKIELQLAKNDVARRQEEANMQPTVIDRILPTGSRLPLARERLKFLDMQEKILLTSLATSEEDAKELMRLLAKDRYPTSH